MSLEIPGIGNQGPLPDYSRTEQQRQAVQSQHPSLDSAAKSQLDTKRKQAQYEKLLEQLFNTVAPYDRQIKYSINHKLGEVVVKVIDTKTDKVIKEIPPADIQKLQAKIREAVGILIDEKI